MAGTLLHITLARRALESASISSSVRAELEECVHDFRLGAVLVDLPYHERIWLSGIKLLLGLDLQCHVWGTLLHVRSPANLARAFLDRADDPAGRALALGLLSHLGVDVVFHREIDRRVKNEADGSRSLDGEHRCIEDQIDLHVHYHLLGHSGMGTVYARRMLGLRPSRSWSRRACSAIREIHGDAPPAKKLERWLAALSLYGLLSCTGRAPWVTTSPRDNPELQQTALELAEESIQLAAKYIEAGLAYLDGAIDVDGLLREVPDLSMADGGCAAPPREILSRSPRAVSGMSR